MAGWQDAFSVIEKALGAIQGAANIPGINLLPYVSTVSSAATALQAGLHAAVDIAPYIVAISKTFAGGLPSEAERKALAEKIKELEAEIDAPLPSPEDGEPD